MAELNAAWAVLRNPAARAAYDDDLVAGARRVAAERRPEDDVVAGAAVLAPEPSRRAARPGTIGPRPSSSSPWGCLLVVLGLIVAALVITAYAASRSEDRLEVETREPLAEGACALVGSEGGGTVLVEVPCTEPHDAEVVARTRFPQPCPTSSRAVLLPDGTTIVCIRQVVQP